MKNVIINAVILTLVTLFFNSCGQAPKQEIVQFIIPAPPEEPRFMHLKTFRGESDFKKKKEQGVLDALIGEGSFLGGRDFVKPYGVTVFNNLVYVTDTGMGVVYVIDTKNQKISFIGDKNSGKLSLPVGIATDSKGNIFVSDSKLQRVFGYDPTGKLIFVLGNNDEFIRPSGIAINKELEAMYVVDTKGHTVRAFSLAGDFLFDIGERGREDGQFNFPTNVTVDQNSGNIIVVDTQNFRIQIFDKDGNHIKTFGNIGDVPGTFSRPKGAAVDSDGNIYVTDAAFDNIQIFDSTGEQLLMYFGESGFDPGQFQMPAGIYIDENDRIHVTENFSGKMQIFQYFSNKWKSTNPEEYKALMNSRKIEE